MRYILFLFLLFEINATNSFNSTDIGIYMQIFDNIAEISRPISPFDLPMKFTQQEWPDIRSDSFRLIGENIRISSQTISFNRTSSNGEKVLIQRNPTNDTYTSAIMIDENQNLIHDLVDNTFYTISSDRLRYSSIPSQRYYFIDFMFDMNQPEQLYLRYLQNNIKWKVHYDLLLEANDTDSVLQAYAYIENRGTSMFMVDSAELISGDVNIKASTSTSTFYGGSGMYADADSFGQAAGADVSATTFAPAPPVAPSEELAGVYIFSINETFFLDPLSTYILPMFRPIIDVERYGLIEKYFRPMDNRGNAQRSYRLRVPDTYLPKGQVFVRESNRLVGEINWSDHSPNETNEFSLGEDPDLQFLEYVQLNSRRQAYEANGYRFILSTYTINLRLINNKKRSINFEYRLRFASQDNLTLKENTNDNLLQLDGSTLTGIFQLDPNEEEEIKFIFETL